MAERRMFSKTVIDSDVFSDMPLTTQALYFHLGMRADDDGFVNNPKKIQRSIGATIDDMKLLVAKGFIIPFESGVIVITHWKQHNYIQKDRYHPTRHFHEMSQLTIDESGQYLVLPVSNMDTIYIRSVSEMDTEVRLGKGRKEENICEEPLQASTPEPEEPSVISFILNDKSRYPIRQAQVDEWSGLYPAVDIMQELRKMAGWLDANPSKRKTKRGILRFVNGWLAREQDKGRTNASKSPQKRPSDTGPAINPNYNPPPGVDPTWDYYKQRGGLVEKNSNDTHTPPSGTEGRLEGQDENGFRVYEV